MSDDHLLDDAMLVFICLLDYLIIGFCYSSLTQESGEFELASTIILGLQATTQLPKCASHPKPVDFNSHRISPLITSESNFRVSIWTFEFKAIWKFFEIHLWTSLHKCKIWHFQKTCLKYLFTTVSNVNLFIHHFATRMVLITNSFR